MPSKPSLRSSSPVPSSNSSLVLRSANAPSTGSALAADGELGFAGPGTEARLARDLARRPRPDLIVTPSVNDNHADHRATAAAVKRAWPGSIARLSYLVWPRIQPHRPRPRGRILRLPLRSRAKMKQAALKLYRSQFGQLVDDVHGFEISRDLRVRFGHPVERFGIQP